MRTKLKAHLYQDPMVERRGTGCGDVFAPCLAGASRGCWHLTAAMADSAPPVETNQLKVCICMKCAAWLGNRTTKGNMGGTYKGEELPSVNKVRWLKEERAKENEKRLDDGVPKHPPLMSEPCSG
jgi:hypothetical protein